MLNGELIKSNLLLFKEMLEKRFENEAIELIDVTLEYILELEYNQNYIVQDDKLDDDELDCYYRGN